MAGDSGGDTDGESHSCHILADMVTPTGGGGENDYLALTVVYVARQMITAAQLGPSEWTTLAG